MWPTSAAFKDAVTRSHEVVVTALLTDSAGGTLATLQPVGGQVDVDETRPVRRTCQLRLVDPTGALVPADAADLLHPLAGNELRLSRGVQLPAGPELAPVGVFRLSKPVIRDGPDGLTIDVQGSDRARVIQRAPYTDPYQVAAGTPGPTALQDLFTSRWPAAAAPLRFNLAPSGYVTPQLTFGVGSGNDPLADAASIALGMGQEVFFDPAGVVTSRPITDPNTMAVAIRWIEGSGCTVVELERDLDDQDNYNGVILDVSNSDNTTALHSEAWDTDPDSPTYYLGPLGRRPLFLTDATVSSQAQADAATAAKLLTVLGATEEVTVTAVTNPAIDAGDIAHITRARAKLDATYAVRSLTIPLGADAAMTCTCRPRAAA
jgi:hypothetical protein